MNMRVGSGNSYTTSISLKNRDGSSAGVITISRPKAKKKKRLSYNFKKISNQILMSKTALTAAKAVNKAKMSVVMLTMRQKSGDYDEEEVKAALEHAKSMERTAKKRKRHMEEEERAMQNGECHEGENWEKAEDETAQETDSEAGENISGETTQELAKELKKLTREAMEESLNDMLDELGGSVYNDMSREEIDDLKRRHRAAELREIMEADNKYLKALFNKLQKEKEQAAASSGAGESAAASLQLGGVEMPVETQEAAAVVEGGAVDVSL